MSEFIFSYYLQETRQVAGGSFGSETERLVTEAIEKQDLTEIMDMKEQLESQEGTAEELSPGTRFISDIAISLLRKRKHRGMFSCNKLFP